MRRPVIALSLVLATALARVGPGARLDNQRALYKPINQSPQTLEKY